MEDCGRIYYNIYMSHSELNLTFYEKGKTHSWVIWYKTWWCGVYCSPYRWDVSGTIWRRGVYKRRMRNDVDRPSPSISLSRIKTKFHSRQTVLQARSSVKIPFESYFLYIVSCYKEYALVLCLNQFVNYLNNNNVQPLNCIGNIGHV